MCIYQQGGPKTWRLQYRFGGKQKMLVLGVYPSAHLADARACRDEACKLLASGSDPGDKKKSDKIEQSEVLTLRDVAIEWHATNKSGRKSTAAVC